MTLGSKLKKNTASKVYYVGCSLWMYVKHVYISDIEASQHSGKLVSILLDKIIGS